MVHSLGSTHLKVTSLCLGTSPLGNSPAVYGYGVESDQAVATIGCVLRSSIKFIDTGNSYGGGESERRVGLAIAEIGGLPDSFVVATKVDPALGSSIFSGQRVRDSVRESQSRLGLDCLQLVYLHDPERFDFESVTGPGGPLAALVQLRDEGVIQYIGVAGGPIDVMLRYVDLGVFDAVISHNRYTLVDQSAEPLVQRAADCGIGFVNAAPYGGGMLVRGPDVDRRYCYQAATESILSRVRTIEHICAAHGVPLAAAALQYSLRDKRVASTIVGMSSPERVEQTLRLAGWPVFESFWSELEDVGVPAFSPGL